MKITIAGLKRDLEAIEIDPEKCTTIQDLKQVILEKSNDSSIESLKLIKGGTILRDFDTLADAKIVEGTKVYAIAIKKPGSSKSSSESMANNNPATTMPSVTPNTNLPQNMFNTAAASGSSAFPFNLTPSNASANAFQSIQQNLMQNPKLMQDMMNNPALQKMISNPQLVQSMMQDPNFSQSLQNPAAMHNFLANSDAGKEIFKDVMSNPEFMQMALQNNEHFKKLFDKNPALLQILQNTDTMSDLIDSYSSEAASDQLNYMNDIALSQIENQGGFHQVNNMYNSIAGAFENMQEDMIKGDQQQANQGLDNSRSTGTKDGQNKSNPPLQSNEPIPNPWMSQNGRPVAHGTNAVSLPRSSSNPTRNTTNNYTIPPNMQQIKYGMPPVPHMPFNPFINPPPMPFMLTIDKLTNESAEIKIATHPIYMVIICNILAAVQAMLHASADFCRSFFSPFGSEPFYILLKNLQISEISDESQRSSSSAMMTNSNFTMALSRLTEALNFISNYDSEFPKQYFGVNEKSNFGKLIKTALEKATADKANKSRANPATVANNQPGATRVAAMPSQVDPALITEMQRQVENMYSIQVKSLVEMGFNEQKARKAIQETGGNIDAAIQKLIENSQENKN